jgi:hypothetical protein
VQRVSAGQDGAEFVYLIGSEGSPIVKIGRSIDVPGRLAAIQFMSPLKLTVLWQTEGGSELEAELHRRFKALRSHGEWFEFPDRDAVNQVRDAIPAIVAEERRRTAALRRARKANKIRKVWSSPRGRTGATEVRAITTFAGFSVGDVVLVAREGWDGRTGVIRGIREHERSFVFVVEENDGGHHRILPLCTPAEMTRHTAAAEVAFARDLPCDTPMLAVKADGTASIVDRRTCMCRSSTHGLHVLQQFIQDLLEH